MSIKGAVKKLEGVLARGGSGKPTTFVIAYVRDSSQAEQIKAQLIAEHGFADKHDTLSIFVIDFAMSA